jgi:putative membrane protein
MILTALNGLCMAVADSVPGVSGGTIAFILGFYDRFLDALHGLFGRDGAARKDAVVYLLKLGVGWCLGMGACVLLLANLFAKNIYFMSSVFLGLTVASVPFVVTAERDSLRGHLKNLPFAALGAALVVALSLLRAGTGTLGNIDFLRLQPLNFVYIFFSGMVAIAAMVLPGISGSTILLIAGVYLPAIQAIRQFLGFNFAEVPGLMALGFGILAGVAVFIRMIRGALRRHRSGMIYLILGLMLGSLYAIVMGPTTLPAPVPALSAATFDAGGFLLGAAVLFGLELLRKATAGKGRSAGMRRGKAAGSET